VWVFTRNQQYDSTATYFDTILGLTMVRVEFKKNQSSINQKNHRHRSSLLLLQMSNAKRGGLQHDKTLRAGTQSDIILKFNMKATI